MHYLYSYNIIKHGNAKIELIEEFDNITKSELLQKERQYILLHYNNLVNKNIPRI
jgi:hypothetical protein